MCTLMRSLVPASFAMCLLFTALIWRATVSENAQSVSSGSGGQFELVKIYCTGQRGSSIKLMLRKEPIEVIAYGGAVIEWSRGKIQSDTVTAKLVQKGIQGKGVLGAIISAEAMGNVALDMKVEVEGGRKAHVVGSCKHLQIDPKESLLVMTGSPQIKVSGISPEISQALGKAGRITMNLESGELLFEPGDEQLIPEVNVQIERKEVEKAPRKQ